MKFLAKLILIILLLPIGLAVIISSTVKFQLLSPNFWKDDFKNNNVYIDLSNDLKVYAENQNIKGGGKVSDLKVITDVITPAIVEDFTTHNLDQTLGFVNGDKKEFLVYIPISKIPKELAPKSSALSSEEIPLSALMSKFNVDAGTIPISQIAFFGQSINYLLIGSLILSILFLFLLFLLTEPGDRFISIGLFAVLLGFLVLSLSKVFTSIQITNKIALDILPSVLQQISKTWTILGFGIIIFGIICFAVKKPNASRQI